MRPEHRLPDARKPVALCEVAQRPLPSAPACVDLLLEGGGFYAERTGKLSEGRSPSVAHCFTRLAGGLADVEYTVAFRPTDPEAKLKLRLLGKNRRGCFCSAATKPIKLVAAPWAPVVTDVVLIDPAAGAGWARVSPGVEDPD
jgi:hypothetical protein